MVEPQAPLPPPAPSRRLPLLIGLGVGVLVLALVGVGLFINNPSNSAGKDSSPSAEAAQSAAAAAVEGYLKALAAGDADTALTYAKEAPPKVSMLTDEVLAATQSLAPTTDIVVQPGTGERHQRVSASYKLGGVPVSTTFEVTNVAGSWLLDQVAAPLPLDTSSASGLGLTLNGIASDSEPYLFPGRYKVAVNDKWYQSSGETVEVNLSESLTETPRLTLSLSNAGVAAVRKAAQAKLKSCIGKRLLMPTGCGFGITLSGSAKPIASTIRWSVTKGKDALKGLKPEPIGDGLLSGKTSIKLHMVCGSTDGRRWQGDLKITQVRATTSKGKVDVSFR